MTLDLQLPIIQAPMAGVQDSALAISVGETGALGSLPCALLTAEGMRREMAAVAARTGRLFNANFFCHQMPRRDAAREIMWRRLLSRYYEELGVTPAAGGTMRRPFGRDALQLVKQFKPAVVSFHFGLPSDDLVRAVKATGALVWSTATTVSEARWLEAHGADAIIAQGLEAGGHRGHFLSEDLDGQITTFELVPQIVSAVSVPVIATGGIADAAGVRSAIALGAVAAQIGTSYLLCPEATTSAVHRTALAGAEAHYTALTNLFSGRPARGIVNRLMRELGPMRVEAPLFPLAAAAVAPLRAAAEAAGRGDFSPLWAGQNLSGLKAIPAAELTRALAGIG